MTQSNLSFLKKAPKEMPFKELISQREHLTRTIPLLDEESKEIVKADLAAITKECSPKWGICKCKIVESMKKTNYLIYVGDGVTTDFSASSKCDTIYALEPLYSKCLSAVSYTHLKKPTTPYV